MRVNGVVERNVREIGHVCVYRCVYVGNEKGVNRVTSGCVRLWLYKQLECFPHMGIIGAWWVC